MSKFHVRLGSLSWLSPSGFLIALVALLTVLSGLRGYSQSTPAPVLIPYTTSLLAGNPALTTGGFSGDGGKGPGTSLNLPSSIAVDSVGNVYIADTSNAVIREINAQTGSIKIIAGVPPGKCTQTSCTANPAYADAVSATSIGIGSGIKGLAVDGNGNVFLADTNTQSVRVIYKGGQQVANLIALVDPSGAATAAAVVPGNIYLLAGAPTAATKGTTGFADNVLATKATFHNPGQLGLDAAGNIYVQDVANGVARVINAQSTTQTFFGYSVQPGFIRAVVGCSSATIGCGSAFGIGGPAGAALFGAALAGLSVDQYGNVYMLDTKGTDPIYLGVAYAGGAALAHLINLESGRTATPGLWYDIFNADPNNTTAPTTSIVVSAALANKYNQSGGLVIRPSAVTVDNLGNVYYLDNHWPALYRIDANSQVVTKLNGTTATMGTAAAPAACSTTVPTLTNDTYGDGCPTTLARISGNGEMTTDADGNVYLADSAEHLVRKLSVNNQFPVTPVGTAVTQMLEVHFDQNNLPASATPTLTSPFTIPPGINDFAILTAPTCSNVTLAVDTSLDCLVPITFTPGAPGIRKGVLQAMAQNGATYSFTLTGAGSGAQLVIDGGGQAVATIPGLSKPSSVALDAAGNEYIADAASNKITLVPANGGAATTIGSNLGLSNPQAIAVDTLGNVFVADTGNGRVVEVTASGTLSVLASGLSKPSGVAVDQYGNVYISDTGNVRLLEVPAQGDQSVATLFQFNLATGTGSYLNNAGNNAFVIPTALAVDSSGNLYVADQGTKAVYKLAAGGSDLQNVYGPQTSPTSSAGGYTTPNGIAVDAAGDIYVSDSGTNLVTEQPSGANAHQFTLGFNGLMNPGGVALDRSGNVYVADSGNGRIVTLNRTNAVYSYGNLGLFQPALTDALTVGNIGNLPITLSTPAYQTSGDTTDFLLAEAQKSVCSGATLNGGITCTLNSSFLPQSGGTFSQTISVQGGFGNGGVTANLSGVAVPPLGVIAVAFSQAPVAGVSTAAVTARVTQPHGTNTPTGTITFVYTVNEGDVTRGGSTATVTVPLLAGANASSSAVLSLTGLLPARRYSVVATYSGDPQDTGSSAAPFTFTVPGGTTLSVIATPVSFAYGQPVPTITGSVSGILPADAAAISYKFTTPASPTTNVGSYPITLLLSGGNYLNYVVPPAVTTSNAPALITETPASLTVAANSVSTVYGADDVAYTATVNGVVNGDHFTLSYSPLHSKGLDVGMYPLLLTLSGPTQNYTVALTNGVLTVTKAGSSLGSSANAPAVLPTNLASEQLAINVVSATSGTPTGTVTLTDTFTPLSSVTANQPVTIGPLPLTNGAATYIPTSQAFGTHSYTLSYSGDVDFVSASNITPTTIIVDNPDFILSTATTPLAVLPGILPGGNQNIPGESAATPETQTITFSPILGYTGTITLTCASPSSYVTCTLSPSTLLISTKTAQTTLLSVQTPATLPTNYTGALRRAGKLDFSFAFLPLGLLAMIPLVKARRNKVTRYLWMTLAAVFMSAGLSGCTTSNLVKFYTPVPQGQQPLTITATDGTYTRTITVTINIQ